MKNFPIIITLFLTLLWFYICWYWYTCQIKGFCYVEKINGQIELEIPEESQTGIIVTETEVPQENRDIVNDEISSTGALQDSASEEILPQEDVSLQKQECADIITQAISL